MAHVAKVKINSVDYRRFEQAAEAAGTSVDRWLIEAGLAQIVKDTHGASRGALPGPGPLGDVWLGVVDDLAREIRSPHDLAYLMLSRLHTIVEDTALLTVPDAFTRDVIESRLRSPIAEALSRRLHRRLDIAVTVASPADHPEPAAESITRDLEHLKAGS